MATLLRTLTKKSQLKFGKYHDFPVWKLLETLNTRTYLVWVYYNSSNINFNKEVLDALFIGEDMLIDKPGKKPEMMSKYQKRLDKWMIANKGYFKASGWKRKTAKRNETNKFYSARETKGSLARKNQGHK